MQANKLEPKAEKTRRKLVHETLPVNVSRDETALLGRCVRKRKCAKVFLFSAHVTSAR